ncbi:LysR family transcriptional regulator [Bacillus sp. GM2]|uniref:LysR family transcriptional regulator n=1 Tax=Bacillus TaxID=1386 RepID=UPI0003422BE6|nr:LysR family transcriptional regulator [Bacillus paralicheniformis]KUL06975.1 LysR family transcriptional regulator [Bacillus licheniformis LMG 7559]AGN35817.1 putative transcriptional regulator YoaU [Bacillus paralicheniformis ATCC 9945a]AYQ15880.1 LysR family transcriptional regulator [Bacillus paralicheniformis]KND08424.1 LysR family transcriptional regulator [Bacillus paralicheniformis]KRT89475.1 LysR family transcriptional regulator [Bacillus paralicheniformis]
MVMNMNSLHIFVKVAETLNMTEAANELYISQPAVSKAIKTMETSLGVKLLIRDKQNKLKLTDAGKEIAVLARQMIVIENKIYQVADQENHLLRGKVKVGSFPAVSTNILPQAIASFKSKYPLVQIELVEGTSDQIKQWVETRLVDLGIVASPFDGFESQVLFQDRMAAVIPEQYHHLKDAPFIDLKKHQNELIFCKGGHEVAVSQIFQKHRLELKENLTVQNAETLVNMVNNNLGIGLISNFSLSSVSHRLIKKDISPQIIREVGMITPSFEEATPAAAEFMKMIIESETVRSFS